MDDEEEDEEMQFVPGCPEEGIEAGLGREPSRNVAIVTDFFQSNNSATGQQWVAQNVCYWCDIHHQNRAYKQEVRTQGLLKSLVMALGNEERCRRDMSTRMLLITALSHAICDDRQSALQAAEQGLFDIVAETLKKRETLVEMQCLQLVTLCNTVVATTSLVTTFLEASGIISLLVPLADSNTKVTDPRVRQIATACLANLSNYDGAIDELIHSNALEVLALLLHEYPVEHPTPETSMPSAEEVSSNAPTPPRFADAPGHHSPELLDAQVELGTHFTCFTITKVQLLTRKDAQAPPKPSVTYMQALAAVVKIVGRGAYMGGNGFEGEERQTAQNVFYVRGDQSTTTFDPSTMRRLILDRRSLIWMLAYLRASIEEVPFPPRSNIYGRPWKVSLSLACIAQGSESNRRILHEIGVWPQLFRAVAAEVQHSDGRVIADAQEEDMTRAHAILAMRKLLRSREDVRRSVYHMGLPEARRALNVIKRVARGMCACAGDSKVRVAAAEVLLIWGQGWSVERLLWLAVLKSGQVAQGWDGEGGERERDESARVAGVNRQMAGEAEARAHGSPEQVCSARTRPADADAAAAAAAAAPVPQQRVLLSNNVCRVMRHLIYLGGEGDLPPPPGPPICTHPNLELQDDGVVVAVLDSLFAYEVEAKVQALPRDQRGWQESDGFLNAEPSFQKLQLAEMWQSHSPACLQSFLTSKGYVAPIEPRLKRIKSFILDTRAKQDALTQVRLEDDP